MLKTRAASTMCAGKKAMGALYWIKEKNPYYADVALDPARLTGIVDGAEIPGVKDLGGGGGPPPRRHGAGA